MSDFLWQVAKVAQEALPNMVQEEYIPAALNHSQVESQAESETLAPIENPEKARRAQASRKDILGKVLLVPAGLENKLLSQLKKAAEIKSVSPTSTIKKVVAPPAPPILTPEPIARPTPTPLSQESPASEPTVSPETTIATPVEKTSLELDLEALKALEQDLGMGPIHLEPVVLDPSTPMQVEPEERKDEEIFLLPDDSEQYPTPIKHSQFEGVLPTGYDHTLESVAPTPIEENIAVHLDPEQLIGKVDLQTELPEAKLSDNIDKENWSAPVTDEETEYDWQEALAKLRREDSGPRVEAIIQDEPAYMSGPALIESGTVVMTREEWERLNGPLLEQEEQLSAHIEKPNTTLGLLGKYKNLMLGLFFALAVSLIILLNVGAIFDFMQTLFTDPDAAVRSIFELFSSSRN